MAEPDTAALVATMLRGVDHGRTRGAHSSGYHELIERAAVTLPRAVAVERALSWLGEDGA